MISSQPSLPYDFKTSSQDIIAYTLMPTLSSKKRASICNTLKLSTLRLACGSGDGGGNDNADDNGDDDDDDDDDDAAVAAAATAAVAVACITWAVTPALASAARSTNIRAPCSRAPCSRAVSSSVGSWARYIRSSIFAAFLPLGLSSRPSSGE